MSEQDLKQDPDHTQPIWEAPVGMTGQYIQGEPESAVDHSGQFPLQSLTEPWRSEEVSFGGERPGYNIPMQASTSTSWGGPQDHDYGQDRMGSESDCYPNTQAYSGDVREYYLMGLGNDSSLNPNVPISDGGMAAIDADNGGYPPLAPTDLPTLQDTSVDNSTIWNSISSNQLNLNTGGHASRQEQRMRAGINSNEAQPWCYPCMTSMDPVYHEHVERGHVGDSGTSYSAVGCNNTDSVSWNPLDYETSTSSASCSCIAMGDSSITVQPLVRKPTSDLNCSLSSSGNSLYDQRFHLPRVNLERSATSQMNNSFSAFHQGHIALGMERSRSSLSSSCTEDSSLDVLLVEKLPCDKIGCTRLFTGVYRKNNLARHKRLCHGVGSSYLCEDNTCAKEFRRPDARLKHYRKRHPYLAANSPYRPRPQGTRRPQ